MQLPGRLRDTTLGDLLGALHREQATGTLELIETGASRAGLRHLVRLEDGQVTAVEGDTSDVPLGELLGLSVQARRGQPSGDYLRIGEVLLNAGLVTRSRLRDALHEQMRLRLEQLYGLTDAEIRFRIPRPQDGDTTAPEPLQKAEFLEGRPRAKTRRGPARKSGAGGAQEALQVLGLAEGATARDVQTAFRRLAQSHHPDRHPHASADEKRDLLLNFSRITRAYHALTG